MKHQITVPALPWPATSAPVPPLGRASISAIHQRIAAKHRVPPKVLRKRCRKDHLVKARWEVFARAYDAGHTLKQIAKAYGMDHSTVLYGIRRHHGMGPKP